jgi:Fanconi anemia group M protein
MPCSRHTLDGDRDLPQFDWATGATWHYPEARDYAVRDYQFNIVEKCLLNNTLVSLPTGMGKTFIAAVVMYNFYR